MYSDPKVDNKYRHKQVNHELNIFMQVYISLIIFKSKDQIIMQSNNMMLNKTTMNKFEQEIFIKLR